MCGAPNWGNRIDKLETNNKRTIHLTRIWLHIQHSLQERKHSTDSISGIKARDYEHNISRVFVLLALIVNIFHATRMKTSTEE